MLELSERNGLAVMIALNEGAAMFEHEGELFRTFDSFGDDIEPERVERLI